MNKKRGIRVPAGSAKNVFARLTDLLRQFGVRSRANEKHGTEHAEGGAEGRCIVTVRGPSEVVKVSLRNRRNV